MHNVYGKRFHDLLFSVSPICDNITEVYVLFAYKYVCACVNCVLSSWSEDESIFCTVNDLNNSSNLHDRAEAKYQANM